MLLRGIAITSFVDEGFLRVSDPDEPIYRIYPLWFLEEALRLKQLVLVQPGAWEDPHESLAEGIAVTPRVQGVPQPQRFLDCYLRPAYAQPWSRTHSSDTLLRAYSRVVKDPNSTRNTVPRDEGVRVRSTPRKLLAALKEWCPTNPSETCFIGSVQYGPAEGLHQHVADLIGKHGLEHFGRGRGRAELLLLKRAGYEHEAEVRLIYVEEREIGKLEPLLRVPCHPNAVFEDLVFDPRLAEFERIEREALVRKWGYQGVGLQILSLRARDARHRDRGSSAHGRSRLTR